MTDVTLPSLGESVTEGIITKWFKKVGDVVARDEPLFEVSTDKVDSEMPSPAAGVLVEILAAEGDTVETGSRVAVIDETPGTLTEVPTSSSAPEPPPPPPTPPSAPQAIPSLAQIPSVAASPEPTGAVVVSPVVRRILNDGGVEASSVRGTGPGGSITRRDAERAVIGGTNDETPVTLSHGQRRMGHHMSMSSQSAPHGFVALEVDGGVFGELERLGRKTRDGEPISDEMVVSLAAVRALAEFDFLNATYADDALVIYPSVNLGLVRAVADDGMLVPVVHAAAGLTLRALARRVNDLDKRVASRQLTTDDLLGGTFTVQGAPSAHALWTTPIIIQPEVAILSAGAARQVPVVNATTDPPTVDVGWRLVLGLSFDHRVCEPVSAARYLERVGELLAGMDLESER